MISGPTDPNWPRLLSLTAHELRSPLTVVAGYIRMLLKDRAGPLTDQQRRLLDEAEKSCSRLSSLVAEISELSHLESGSVAFNRSSVDLGAVLSETISALPELPDRTIRVDLSRDGGTRVRSLRLQGDAVRLKTAFTSILGALRRELVTSDQLTVHLDAIEASVRITIGEAHQMDQLLALTPADMTTFDEWRGGNGLSLATARRIIEAHGGRIWEPANRAGEKATAVLIFAIG